MLDSDLATPYEVTAGNFNKAVSRNAARFPKEFSFVLNREELANMIFRIGTSRGHGGRRKLPRVPANAKGSPPPTVNRCGLLSAKR